MGIKRLWWVGSFLFWVLLITILSLYLKETLWFDALSGPHFGSHTILELSQWSLFSEVRACCGLEGRVNMSLNCPTKPPFILWQTEYSQPPIAHKEFTMPVFPYSVGLVAISVVTIALWFFNWMLHCHGYSWSQWCSLLWDHPVGHPFGQLFGGTAMVPPEACYVKPCKYAATRKVNHHRQLGFALALLASSATGVSPFHLKSESQLCQHFCQFWSFQGLMNVDKLQPTDKSLLHQHITQTNAEFAAAAGGNANVFNAICDTGCSFSVTNDAQDAVPGSMQKLDAPITLGGIAGSLKIEHVCTVQWDAIDDYGNVAKLNMKAFYHPDIPNCLLSPQAFLTETSKNLDDHF